MSDTPTGVSPSVVQLPYFLWTSTPYLLSYALPLLFVSIIVTFSGTFLTLDRSRSFSPRSDAQQTLGLPGSYKEYSSSSTGKLSSVLSKLKFRLDGGIGGLAVGFLFGVHASTFLALLIVNKSSTASLSRTTFLVIWVLCALPLSILGGRWRSFALIFAGLTGGISVSLGLSILMHPALGTRIVLSAVFTVLITLLVIIPPLIPSSGLSNLIHSTYRFATSAIGAFTCTLSLALLTRSDSSISWASPWDRLWVANGANWENSRERGLDAVFCFLWIGGAAVDWALHHWIGEDPDQKWDAYLAEYSHTLPNLDNRAGNFQPLQSWWTRLLDALHLSSSDDPFTTRPHKIIFPPESFTSSNAAYVPEFTSQKIATGEVLGPSDSKTKSQLEREKAMMLQISSKGRGSSSKDGMPHTSLLQDDELINPDDYYARGVARRPTVLSKGGRPKKARNTNTRQIPRKRVPVRFRTPDELSSSSDESANEVDDLKTPLVTPVKAFPVHVRLSPPQRRGSLSSSTTLTVSTTAQASLLHHEGPKSGRDLAIDIEKERARLALLKSSFGGQLPRKPKQDGPQHRTLEYLEYSDVEEDVTAAYSDDDALTGRNLARNHVSISGPNWKPSFLEQITPGSDVPAGAVPATPSLLRALDRIAIAHAQAFGPQSPDQPHSRSPSPLDGLPPNSFTYPPQALGMPKPDHITISIPAHLGTISSPVADPIGLGLEHSVDETEAQVDSSGYDSDAKAWSSFWRDVHDKAAEVDRSQ